MVTMGLVERFAIETASGVIILEVIRLLADIAVSRHSAAEQMPNVAEPSLNTVEPTSFAASFTRLGEMLAVALACSWCRVNWAELTSWGCHGTSEEWDLDPLGCSIGQLGLGML